MIGPSSSLCDWVLIDIAEMPKFKKILGCMGLVPLPNIHYYWSNRYLYKSTFVAMHCHNKPVRNNFENVALLQ